MRILGIETSCDETAAAVVARASDGKPEICSNVILSQADTHAEFGGVVPELAARAHLGQLDRIILAALEQADTSLEEIDGIGVTAGPGLTGGLLVGTVMAQAIAASANLPCLAVNHLEGHALTARLTDNISFPYLLLLVSGGHSQILLVRGVGDYSRWATTIDDAVGECFDKTAKLLGLPYPGGPSVEMRAESGDASRFDFPRPLSGKDEMMMSFSGLKTAVRQEAERLAPLLQQDIDDVCAGLQAAISDILVDRCMKSMRRYIKEISAAATPTLVVAGGVAANQRIRSALEHASEETGWRLIAPPLSLCTDNAAMIGWAALERFEAGQTTTETIIPRPRWPLDEHAARMIGSGRKGAKA